MRTVLTAPRPASFVEPSTNVRAGPPSWSLSSSSSSSSDEVDLSSSHEFDWPSSLEVVLSVSMSDSVRNARFVPATLSGFARGSCKVAVSVNGANQRPRARLTTCVTSVLDFGLEWYMRRRSSMNSFRAAALGSKRHSSW